MLSMSNFHSNARITLEIQFAMIHRKIAGSTISQEPLLIPVMSARQLKMESLDLVSVLLLKPQHKHLLQHNNQLSPLATEYKVALQLLLQ